MLQLVWGWQPALYLFLGGMGAGAFIMAAVLFLMDGNRHRTVVCVSMWAALVCLAGGLLLLVTELIVPLRGVMMWRSFSHFTSWMTFGAWGAFGAICVFGVSAVLATPFVGRLLDRWGWYVRNGLAVRRALAVLGIALGAFVAVYTGMLLKTSQSIALWNTFLLPALFTVSALDTGVALVEVIAMALVRKDPLAAKAGALMETVVVVLVLLELAVLTVFLASMMAAGGTDPTGDAAAASAQTLVSGSLAPLFWGLIVVVGLLLPLGMALLGLGLHRRATHADRGAEDGSPSGLLVGTTAIGALGAIVGGCALRFLVLGAGAHADVMAQTMEMLLM